MKSAREFVNLPVISIEEGLKLGKVKDLYLDEKLQHVTAIYLGTEGLLNRSESFIRRGDIVTLGPDAILVQNTDRLLQEAETPELTEWLKRWVRRDDVRGREMKTPDGTKIGRVGDIVLDGEAKVVGVSLSQALITNPLADKKILSRTAIIDSGDGSEGEDAITIELAEAIITRGNHDGR